MAGETVFAPPYLRYAVPAELKDIQDQIKLLTDTTMASLVMSGRPPARSWTGIPVQWDPNTVIGSPSQVFAPGVTTFQLADAASSEPSQTSSRAAKSAAPLAKTAALAISLMPRDTVTLGFNCRETFSASYMPANTTHAVWNLLMKNQQTGQFDQIFFMGGESSIDKKKKFGSIKFDHDFSSYRDAAYASLNNKAIFKVQVRPFLFFDEGETLQSNAVTLDFSPTSCIGIHSVSLSTGSVTGGANHDEPTLTVALDAPAGPGGQKVALSVDDRKLGGILGSGYFVIPAGKTSESISGFLGTQRVLTTGKKITITARLVSPSGNSGPGHATVKLTKQ